MQILPSHCKLKYSLDTSGHLLTIFLRQHLVIRHPRPAATIKRPTRLSGEVAQRLDLPGRGTRSQVSEVKLLAEAHTNIDII